MKNNPLSDLDDEIRDHILRETAENIERGLTPEQARYQALRRFGSVALAKENARTVWFPIWLEQLRQDLRYGLRTLSRNPGFTFVAIVTLALGIGLTTAVFSVVHAVLVRPLPYAGSERIVAVWETHREFTTGRASVGHFHDWTEQATVFEATAATLAATYNLSDAGDPERVNGMRVTPGYFQVAYLPPALGRYFTSDDVAADARVVVLSHLLWQRRFGGDPSVVGRDIRLNGEVFRVTGIAPSAFALTDPDRAGVTGGFSAHLWTPLVFSPQQRANYGNHSFLVLAKLKPGISREVAQADLERVTRTIGAQHPRETESRGAHVQLLRDVILGNVTTQLLILLAFVLFVLLIGCVNIAGLLLARATARRKEIAIRASLGGGRPRIVRQLLTESLMLAVLGGIAAVVVAYSGIRFFVDRGPLAVPRLAEAGLHLEVLLFGLGVTVGAAALFGAAPAIRASRTDAPAALRESAHTAKPMSRERLRILMVIAEIAVTVMLLVGSGLFFRSAIKLQQVPLGFTADNVLTARVALPAARYQEPRDVSAAYGRMLEEARAITGTARVAVSTTIPLFGSSVDSTFAAEGKSVPPDALPSPHVRLVSDGYFEALGMHILRGRPFLPSDMRPGAAPAVVVNQRLAATLWQDEDPLGKRLSGWTAGDEPEWREVVGVVGDVRSFGQQAAVQPEIFLPYTQAPQGSWDVFQRSMAFLVDMPYPENATAPLRTAIRAVDPTLPLYDVRTMESRLVTFASTRRFMLRLLMMLAATGLALASIGIYGVVAYFVTQRTSEIGLRLALGADPRGVVRMVVGHGLKMAGAGVAIGLLAALPLSRGIAGLLFEIEPTDLQTYVAVAALLTLTTLVASWIPAAIASRIDPLVAIKHE